VSQGVLRCWRALVRRLDVVEGLSFRPAVLVRAQGPQHAIHQVDRRSKAWPTAPTSATSPIPAPTSTVPHDTDWRAAISAHHGPRFGHGVERKC
jgi:hypothetical protein